MVLCTTPSTRNLDPPCWMPPQQSDSTNENCSIDRSQLSSTTKKPRNFTIAFNYQVSLVDEFVGAAPLRRNAVETVPDSTGHDDIAVMEESERTFGDNTSHNNNTSDTNNNSRSVEKAPIDGDDTNSYDEKDSNLGIDFVEGGDFEAAPSFTSSETMENQGLNANVKSSARRSNRDTLGKRKASLARTRVKYDMDLVPPMERNEEFLRFFGRKWWMRNILEEDNALQNNQIQKQPSRRSTRLHHDDEQLPDPLIESPSPFLEDGSVLWEPAKRSEWEDCIFEMTAVCVSAENRRRERMIQSTLNAAAPLSQEYIKDRVDIDDPLNGYQIRHTSGGWLQGFLMWTNFTTWTRYFRWDSLHPQSGIPTTNHDKVDRSGVLSKALEALPRTGDPLVSGIIFENVAEIGLVGSLGGGCGEYLLHMALDDIRSRGQYKFVVLQATDSSRGFYEKFGFIRVGAICRYETQGLTKSVAPLTTVDENSPEQNSSNPIVGYRHWTHNNESHASLQMHGGPSYMMALALHSDGGTQLERDGSGLKSFLNTIRAQTSVKNKPTVMSVTNAASLATLQRRLSSLFLSTEFHGVTKKRLLHHSLQPGDIKKEEFPTLKRSASTFSASSKEPACKRRKLSVVTTITPSATTPCEETAVGEASIKPSVSTESTEHTIPKRRVSTRKKPKSSSKRKSSDEKSDRTYYSVRGLDGRFMRIPIGEQPPSEIVAVAKKAGRNRDAQASKLGRNSDAQASKAGRNSDVQVPKLENPLAPTVKPRRNRKSAVQSSSQTPSFIPPNKSFRPIDPSVLRKQKVKAYPRARPHFYNRVVKPIDGRSLYYFVFEYNEDTEQVRLVPLEARGILIGKRQGRPRYQCCIGTTDENFITDTSQNYKVVDAVMVMKTPLVAQEAWDIEDDK